MLYHNDFRFELMLKLNFHRSPINLNVAFEIQKI